MLNFIFFYLGGVFGAVIISTLAKHLKLRSMEKADKLSIVIISILWPIALFLLLVFIWADVIEKIADV